MSSMRRAFTPEDLLNHRAWLKGLARSLLNDDARAEDVVQETCLAAMEQPPREASTSGPWLARVLRNRAYRAYRGDSRRRRREASVARPLEQRRSPTELLQQAELQQQISEAVTLLDEPYRSTVLFRFFEDMSPTEIARQERIPVTTVRSRLDKALETLRQKLDKEHGDRRQAWATLLIPIAQLNAKSSASLGSSAASHLANDTINLTQVFAGGFAMSAKPIAAAITVSLIALVSLVWFFQRDDTETPELSALGDPALESKLGIETPRRANDSDTPASESGSVVDVRTVENNSTAANSTPSISGIVRERGNGETISDAVITVFRPIEWATIVDEALAPLDKESGDLSAALARIQSDIAKRRVSLPSTRSDAEGFYALPSLPPGEYRLIVQHERFLPNSDTHLELGAEPIQRDIELLPGLTISGHVRDSNDAPVSGATLRVALSSRVGMQGDSQVQRLIDSWRDGTFAATGVTTNSQPDGSFRIGSLESALYDIQVTKAGFASQNVREINAGQDSIEIILSDAMMLSGRAVLPNLSPAKTATISLDRVLQDKPRPAEIGMASSEKMLPLDFDANASNEGVSVPVDGRGHFAVKLSPGRYRLRVDVVAYPRLERLVSMTKHSVDVGDLVLPLGHAISGQVTRPNGMPLAEATVWVETPETKGIAYWASAAGRAPALVMTETDTSGNYRVEGLELGTYSIRAAHADYVAAVTTGVRVEIASESKADLQLSKGGVARGIVLNGTDDSPIEGALIELSEHTDMESKSVRSDSAGRFEMRGLTDGSHFLRASVGEFSSAYEEFIVSSTSSTAEKNFSLFPPSVFQGQIVDEDGEPVAGATVQLDSPDSTERARSSADGAFELVTLIGSSKSVELIAKHGIRGTGRSQAIPVDSGKFAEVEDLQIVVSPRASITGRVLGSDGKPVVSASIEISRKSEHAPGRARSTHTDTDGRFEIRDVESGTYKLSSRALGYAPFTLDQLTVAEKSVTQDILLDHGRSLRGKVIDESDSPLPGALIFALVPHPDDAGSNSWHNRKRRQDAEAFAVTRTDENGEYELKHLPTGSWTVFARSAGYSPSEFAIIDENETMVPDLQVTLRSSVFGKVVDAKTGAPIPNFRIWMNLQKNHGGLGGRGMLLPRDFTPLAGQFEIESITPEDYFFILEAPGYRIWASEFELAPGESEELQIRLEHGAIVQGVVLDELTKNPISGATVFVRHHSRKAWSRRIFSDNHKTTTAADGSFAFDVLDEVEYSLSARHPSFSPAKGRIQVVGGQAESVEVSMHPAGQVSGKLLFSGKVPTFSSRVELHPTGDTGKTTWATLGRDGKFHAQSVRAGEYELILRVEELKPEKRNAPAGTSIDMEKDMIVTETPLGTITVKPGEIEEFEAAINSPSKQ